MLHEFYIVFMQFFADIGKVVMQLAEIVREVEAHMETKIDRCVDAGFCEAFRPVFYFVYDLFLWPQQIVEGGPPAGGATGHERYVGV